MTKEPPVTFDELQETIIDSLAQQGSSIREIADRIIVYKDCFSPDHFDLLRAEIKYVNEARKNIDVRVRALFDKAVVDRTGLYTRLYFDERIRMCENTSYLAYLMCDIDKFHDYN